ncbi:MAG: Ig-like domain repeat protein [Gemmataceae bacterium]
MQTGGLSAGTTVNSGGTLAVENNITVTNELLTLNGAGQGGIGALYNAAGNNTWSNTITLGSNSHIGVALAGDNLTIDRSIVQASSNLGVTKVGLGTLTYAGGAGTSNSYTGLTTINEGTLALNKTGGAVALNGNLTIGDGVAPNATALWQTANQVIDSATIRVESDGLLNLNGLAETIATLRILDGMAQTGNNGQLTVGTLLDMVGGTATIGTSGQINLGGSVSGNSSGVGPALIQGAGNLSLNGSNRDFTIANGPNATDMRITAPISGSGVGVNKLGDGLLELNALNTYTGTTTIEAGTVQVGGTIGAVDLDGGTLSGTGTTGAVNGGTPATAAEGIVSPGNTGPGILNTGASVWGGNTDFRVELNTPSGGPGVGYDQLRVTGSINLGNLSLGQSELVGIVGPGVGIGDSFTIITATGGVSGQFVQGNTVFIDGKKFSVVYNPNNVILTRIKADVNMVLVSSTAGNQSVYGQDVTFTVTVTPETGAGPLPLVGDTVTFTLDGVYVKPPQNLTTSPGTASMNPFTDFGIILPPNASHSVLASFSGDVDFNSSFVFLDPEQSVLKASTQVNASVSPANPVFGETVTINVNIVDLIPSPKLPAAAIPTGTVTFTIDGVVGSPELLTGATISRQLTGLSVGAHTVQISYSGDGNYLPSSTTQAIQITVNRANTEVSLSPVPSSPIPKGDTVQFFATVTAVAPGAGIPSGTVFFYDGPVNGGILLGSDDLDSFGIASIATNSLGVGNHTITAFYAGNTDFNSDESSIPFTIGPALTQTVITSTPSSTVFGQTVTFTAGVTSANPVNGVPVGTVTFIIDGGLVVSPNLSVNSLGSASWSINTLGAGPHSVVAQFNANTNFATSSSDPLNYTVNQANTKVAVSSSINPGAAGDPVELRAAVSAIAPGVGAVTGNVKFFVNGVERGTAPIVAGVARLPVTFSSQGTFAITATFVGSTNYAPSNSNATPFSQRIVAFGSTTTFVNPTAANPTSVTGQKVSFVAEVRNKITNALVTSGTVTFFINGVAQTPVALNANGRAVLGRPYNPGSYTITARYNGNANVASSSTSKILTVSKANTAVVLTPSRNPSYTNVASSVTATVNPVAPGGGIPTGSVTFSVNGNPRAPINLTNGKATLNLGLLSVGNYTITAIYNGSPNYNGSLTTTFQLTVTNPPPASKLTAAPTGAVFANTPFVVRATARDSSNQIVTGYNIPATIKLVSAPAGASFTGNKNVTFVNGVATFTNLVVNRSGRYVFRVTTGNLTIDFVVVVASRLL